MRQLLLLTISIFLAPVIHAQITPKWARYPAISPDGSTIAFTYKGDLYRVPASGGRATQLTFHSAHDFMPVWSKDGQKIAFASDRYGNFDVFVMAAEGGEASRLTYHSNDEFPYTFSADGSAILFGGNRQDLASHRQYPTASQPELYSVPVTGGRVQLLLTTPAEYVQVSKDGSMWLYHDKKGGENEWRKHHQSSIARDVWSYDAITGKHTKVTSFYGEDRNPVFAADGESIFYLSEASGTFNIHKLSLANPAQQVQVTKLATHPVRSLTIADNGLMSFSYDGELYTVKEGEEPRKVGVTLYTQDQANNDSYIAVNGGVREMDISPDGKEVAFIARGEVFVSSVDGKLTKRVTSTPEQERFVKFAPDGKSLLYASERDGRWQIFQTKKARPEEPFFFASTLLEETPLVSNAHDNYLPELSPDGKKLAFIENRKTLRVLRLDTKDTLTLLTPEQLFHMQDGDQYFTWSPDSKWLLATYRPTMVNSEVVLLDTDGKRPMVNLTQSGYSDRSPKWVNGGKQLLWFSNRDGLKSHATSGATQMDVYALFFTKEAWDRFNLDKDDFNLLKELEKANKKDDKDKKDEGKDNAEAVTPATPLVMDWAGLHDRKARLTIHSSSLSDAVLSKDGEKLYYLARFEKDANLWSTDLRTKETKMEIALNASGGSLMWDKAMKNLYLLSGGRITKITPENNKREQINVAGEMLYDAAAERQHMFEHVWLRTKKMFYTPDMHGADWDGLRESYAKYLPHIGNSYEFAEMLSELLGELNVSHAGARYSSNMENGDETASLGIFMDYGHQGHGIRIAEIIQGGPLDKANLDVKAGMIIEKIDGDTIAPNRDVARYLNRKAAKFVLIEVIDPATNKRQQLTIKPVTLAEENRLLYRRWVKRNQEEVDSLSGGKLGYVHISGMNDGQYRNTYEEMMGKYADRKGVIVDTRFNGGGDLVADLAMFFTGEQFLDYATADRSVGYEPTFRWTKPTLAMFNEANYSDGHCFSCGYTDLKIGKTVGMPVPGTCSFAGWEMLPDGVRWGAVPISAKNKAGEWLENNETKPMFEVKNMPDVIAKGKDQQLEKAIEELLKDVE
ncbi:C-terminal processing protease CtpA/Prc, contains a PDZ domain [Parapedobacter luteus]|uniref:Tricorn protease homolog n=1 Tax=Parapedobacter luteus TaxID=623280 RepID=A0A1T5AWQ5_9SPHI|nr:S41 family peptidase [Parapedobacter luteus]SKB39200.1 C-terminal processing protease CtpA/Prc, contains a PDZ domain [Parapedobacter luteus]